MHAFDADQAEAILIRWGLDGLGKLGGERPLPGTYFLFFLYLSSLL